MNKRYFKKILLMISFGAVIVLMVCTHVGNVNNIRILANTHIVPVSNYAKKEQFLLPAKETDESRYILLLAYPRSGSTFTGELLSVRNDVFYLYEPSNELRNIARNITDPHETIEILNGMYNCKNESLEMLDANHKGVNHIHFFYRNWKPHSSLVNDCLNAKIHLIKGIRLSMQEAIDLYLAQPELNLKIVHLVRDPRAMYNSMKRFAWEEAMIDAEKCTSLRNNLKLANSIPPENHITVRYEDIANNVLDTTARIYNFLGLQLSDALAVYIAKHVQVEELEAEPIFGTYRKKNFDPNHWKRNLKVGKIKDIECNCKDVMNELGYEMFDS